MDMVIRFALSLALLSSTLAATAHAKRIAAAKVQAPLQFTAKYRLQTVSGFVVGIRVDEVLPDSAEEQAGLRSRDIVLSIDGSPTQSIANLQLLLRTVFESKKAHSAVIRRDGFQGPVTLPLKPVKKNKPAPKP